MAGDWIKMRDNLWDDPRIAKIVDMTDSSEAAVIGALYWLWATADQHTEDGILPGLTVRSIDRKTGVKGFAEALCSIDWLEDNQEGVRIVDFEKHNGSSAKKRCQTAKRVANFTAVNGKLTLHVDDANADSVSSALAREREEKRREDKIKEEEISARGKLAAPAQKSKPKKTAIPENFDVSERVLEWSKKYGFDRLDEHLDAFRRKVAANGYQYASWDDAFMEAVREDWAKIRSARGASISQAVPSETKPKWALDAGFESIWDANNSMCFQHNAKEFRNGKKLLKVVA